MGLDARGQVRPLERQLASQPPNIYSANCSQVRGTFLAVTVVHSRQETLRKGKGEEAGMWFWRQINTISYARNKLKRLSGKTMIPSAKRENQRKIHFKRNLFLPLGSQSTMTIIFSVKSFSLWAFPPFQTLAQSRFLTALSILLPKENPRIFQVDPFIPGNDNCKTFTIFCPSVPK